jgi:hypothetical protein
MCPNFIDKNANTEYYEVISESTRNEEYDTIDNSFHIENGFVILLDVLGIKGIWKRKNPESITRTWKDIIERFDNSIRSTFDRHARLITLSDTIIITCECNISCINSVFESIMTPFIYSVEHEFFLRGSISYGITYRSSLLLIGKPIDDAVQCHDQLEWIGIATTPHLSLYYLNNLGKRGTENYIYYPDIPVKKVDTEHKDIYSPFYFARKERYPGLALNWFNRSGSILGQLINQKNNQSKLEIKCKYENTLAFFDYCREQNE